MKKLLSIILAAMMLASSASMAVSAKVLFEDDFERTGEDTEEDLAKDDFWGGIGAFFIEEIELDDGGAEGVMHGYEQAKIGQSVYKHDTAPGRDAAFVPYDVDPESRCYKEFTIWTDVQLLEEAIVGPFHAGFWLTDVSDLLAGYVDSRTIYNLVYCAKSGDEEEGNVKTAYAKLYSDNPQKDKDYPDNVYGELDLPEAGAENEDGEFVPGFNLDGEAVKLGIRYGQGNITGYANGKIVASYNYETIGLEATPIVYMNSGCYVRFDNFGLGTYDENVKARTRNASYALSTNKVSVSNGVADAVVTEHKEDDTVTIKAPAAAEAGKSFAKWQMKIGGRVVSDAANDGKVDNITIAPFEAAKLLHGIDIGDLNSAELTFTMPNEDVELVATYKDAEPHAITVNSGTADAAQAVVGTKVNVTANAAPEGKSFDKWVVVKGDVTFEDATKASTSFVMVDAEVEISATYKDGVSFIKGDANGDGTVNARDISAIMKAILGNAPAGYNAQAADYNGDGTINARDISAIMKDLLK